MTINSKRLLQHILSAGIVLIMLAGVLLTRPPVLASVICTVSVFPLVAETSLVMEEDTDDTMVVTVYIERIKDITSDLTEPIPGDIGSYSATATTPPEIEILGVRGVTPYDSPTFNPGTGVFSASSVSPEQPTHSPVAKLVLRLNGSCLAASLLQVAFQEIISATDPGINVPEESPNSLSFLRGDARDSDGVVNIVDAMFIAQYTVGLRTLGEINGVNAACVRHDTPGDKTNIVDAMFIAQYTVGLRDENFELP
ncbi:hypothetical protein ACFLTL_00270 [Chloroflexota bacterium]